MKVKLVSGPEDVKKQVARFNRDLEADALDATGRRLAERLSYNRAWYFIPEIDAVGPSKFIGYEGMTAARYDPYRFDGKETEPRLRQWFRPLEAGSREEALVRAKVESLLAAHGKELNKAVRFCGPIGWKAVKKAVGRRAAATTHSGRRTIHATITHGDSFFVAECEHLAVVTQGRTVDETLANLKEAIELHLEDEDLLALGMAADPVVLVTMELLPWAA